MLYDVAHTTYHADRWEISILPENKPFKSRGQPASFFPGRAIVIGSSED